MGLRGPAKKPTELVLLEGNRGKRPINKNEPKPRRKAPHCPEHLDDVAKAEWKRLCPILNRMRVLTEADYMELAALCQVYSTWVTACEELAESKLVFTTDKGYSGPNPLLGIINRCVEQINRLGQQFGLTPSSRTRLNSMESKDERTPYEKVMEGAPG